MTNYDTRILTFASVHRIVGLDQVKVLLRDREDDAGERLEALAGAGRLRRDRAARAMPDVFRITHAGLATLGSDLVAPSLSERRRHDIGIGWLWLAVTRGRFGGFDRLFTEREMRTRDGDRAHIPAGKGGEPPFGVMLSGDYSPSCLHYPDLLLVADWERAALQLQLVHLPVRHLEAVISGCARQATVRVLIYLISDPSIGRSVEQAVDRLGFVRSRGVQRITTRSSAQ